MRGSLAAVAALVMLLAPASAGASQVATPLYWNTGLAKRAGGEYKWHIHSQTKLGNNLRLMVLREREIDGSRWIALRPPWRPNDRLVWAPSRKFRIYDINVALQLDLSSRKLSLYRQGRRAWTAPVVVGKPETPTPRGLFAVYDRYRAGDAMRPWVFETTAHSESLQSFMGGEARVALHGRHGWLRAPWGSASSNGCVRTPDWALRKIRRHLRLGMPVRIRS